MILIDASPIVSLMDAGEAHHQRCKAILSKVASPLVTTWPVYTEAMYLLGDTAGWWLQHRLACLVESGRVSLVEPTSHLITRMHTLMAKYADLPMDLADASLVAVAEERETDVIFTLDSDFDVYRLHGKKKIKRIP